MAAWTGPYIRPEMRLLAELRVADPKRSIREIALSLGLNYQTCLMWQKKPLYIAYESWLVDKKLEEIEPVPAADRKALRQNYLDNAQEMQDRLLTILETSSDPKLQASIAQDWLDRSDLGAPKVEEKRAPIFVIPERLLDALVTRAVEAGLVQAPSHALEAELVTVGDSDTPRD